MRTQLIFDIQEIQLLKNRPTHLLDLGLIFNLDMFYILQIGRSEKKIDAV